MRSTNQTDQTNQGATTMSTTNTTGWRAATRATICADYEIDPNEAGPIEACDRFALVEESRYDCTGFLTFHETIADALAYNENQDHPDDWNVAAVIDLTTGEEVPPVPEVTPTTAPETLGAPALRIAWEGEADLAAVFGEWVNGHYIIALTWDTSLGAFPAKRTADGRVVAADPREGLTLAVCDSDTSEPTGEHVEVAWDDIESVFVY